MCQFDNMIFVYILQTKPFYSTLYIYIHNSVIIACFNSFRSDNNMLILKKSIVVVAKAEDVKIFTTKNAFTENWKRMKKYV